MYKFNYFKLLTGFFTVFYAADPGSAAPSPAPAPAADPAPAPAPAPAADPAPSPAPASASSALENPAPSPAADPGGFYGGITDQKARDWAEAKGFKDLNGVVTAAHNLEKLIGFDKAGRTLVMPGEDSTPEQIAEFRQKLGVPKTADDYKLPLPEGDPGDFAKLASAKFLELGIPAPAAQELAKWWNEQSAGNMAAGDEQFAITSDAEFKEWEKKQGAAKEQNLELYKRAVNNFIPGTNMKEKQEVVAKMERAVGTGKFMDFMTKIASGISEHTFTGGDGPGALTPTPAQARAKIEELKSNKEWREAYLNGDKAKLAEMEALQKLAAS